MNKSWAPSTLFCLLFTNFLKMSSRVGAKSHHDTEFLFSIFILPQEENLVDFMY